MILDVVLFFSVMLPFGILSMFYDLRDRKVSNLITLSFLYISLLVFLFNLVLFSIIDYFAVFVAFLVAFLIYRYDIWGGADGKIFLGIVLILISLSDVVVMLSFLLNLMFFYTFFIIILVIHKTKFKTQWKVLKTIDFGFLIFYVLLIFLIVKSFLRRFFDMTNPIYAMFFILGIYFLIQKTNKYLKGFFSGLRKDLKWYLVIVLGAVFAFVSDYIVWIYFVIIFLLRVSTQFFSDMTLFLKDSSGEKFYSPFSVYLFAAAIFSFLVRENIVSLIIKLLSF